jgi:hypothetical protein
MKDSPANQFLEHLCDVELENVQGKKPVISRKGKVGEYLVSGEGAVFGANLNGTVQWDLTQEADELRTGFTLMGEIVTDDSARIRFDTLGFMKRGESDGAIMPSRYQMTGSIYFETDSSKYLWLNNVLGVWQGYYDMASFRHSYRIYIQRTAR